MTRSALPFLLLLASCSSDDGADPPAPPPDGEWSTLLAQDWTLEPGQEAYLCVRQTVTEDIYVGGFDSMSPLGTHHTVLSAVDPGGPDGVEECFGGQNALEGGTLLYGSGVGTQAFDLPEGIAVKIDAGKQLLLDLHLINTTGAPLLGSSGTKVKRVAPEGVVHVADATLMGTISINLPPHAQTKVIGGCHLAADATIVGLLPHMHQLGIHMKVVHESEAGEAVIHDGPYAFDEQRFVDTPPIPARAGDRIRVECTYDNTRDETVRFGDSSLDEMCFAGVRRYPAANQVMCIDY